MPNATTTTTATTAARIAEKGSVAVFGLMAIGIMAVVSFDTGGSGIGLFLLGGILGAIFLAFHYGFSSAWRRFLVAGDSMGLASHFLLIGLCALLFIPAQSLGLMAQGTVAPVATCLLVGSFLFGIGMQLANGCGSGVLFSFGGGSGRMIVALPFFVIGSVLGAHILPGALEWGSIGQVAIGGGLGDGLRLLVNLVLIGGVGGGLYYLGRKRGQTLPRRLIIASVGIALLCWAVFALSGHPWGVTFGFTLWGAKIAQGLGIPIGATEFWQWAGPKRALEHSVLSDVSSLMDIGMILGAGTMAAATGLLTRQDWPSMQQLTAAAIGGLLMGVGARLGFGCNIGAFLGGIASGSLHGWVWFGMALAGNWAGVRLRPYFGMEN